MVFLLLGMVPSTDSSRHCHRCLGGSGGRWSHVLPCSDYDTALPSLFTGLPLTIPGPPQRQETLLFFIKLHGSLVSKMHLSLCVCLFPRVSREHRGSSGNGNEEAPCSFSFHSFQRVVMHFELWNHGKPLTQEYNREKWVLFYERGWRKERFREHRHRPVSCPHVFRRVSPPVSYLLYAGSQGLLCQEHILIKGDRS